jgi:hypothetical protein
MARKKTTNQDPLLQLVGATQQMRMYRKKNGEFGFRKKGGITSDRYFSDPNYEMARLNALDFAKAGKAGKLIRRAFAPMTPSHTNSDLFVRLVQLCKAVIKSDTTHERGYRNLLDGDLSMFTKFEFTLPGFLADKLRVPFTLSVDRAAGTAAISLPEYVPAAMIAFPDTATHYRLKLGAATLNLNESTHTFSHAQSADIPQGESAAAPATLTAQIPAGTTDLVLVALAIEYFTLEHGVMYPVRDSNFNLMKLVGVDVVV